MFKCLILNYITVDQGFSNFLLDAPLVTKFKFHSSPNKLTDY